MAPTRRALLVWIVAGVALLVYPAATPVLATLAVINAVLLAVVLIDWRAAVSTRHLVIARDAPGAVPMNGSAIIRWELTNNHARRSMVLRFAEEVVPSFGLPTDAQEVRIGPGDTVTVKKTCRPSRRGKVEFGPISVNMRSPLGLSWHHIRVNVPGAVRVNPPFAHRTEAEMRIRRARRIEAGLRLTRGSSGGTEFEQLRDYGPDDEFRRIDWSASARAGRPIVRTYRPERNQSVMLMLDNGRTMAATVGGVRRLDHGIDASMMLMSVALGVGDRVGFTTFDQDLGRVLAPGRSTGQLARATERMYALEPVLAESDYRVALAGIVSRFRRRSLLVLLSDLNESVVNDSLMPACKTVVRTHLVMVGAVADPQIRDWTVSRPTDRESVFMNAAALDAAAARRRAAKRLQSLGVVVVDAEPGRLGIAISDRYLSLKSTGRL